MCPCNLHMSQTSWSSSKVVAIFSLFVSKASTFLVLNLVAISYGSISLMSPPQTVDGTTGWLSLDVSLLSKLESF